MPHFVPCLLVLNNERTKKQEKMSVLLIKFILFFCENQQAMQTSPTDKLNSSYSSSNGNNVNKMDGGMEARSRTERIQQLREQHQRRHMERQGHYPLDEREEHYDQALRQVR